MPSTGERSSTRLTKTAARTVPSRTERSGQAALRRGVHSFSLRYFDTNGGILEAGIIDSEGRRIPFSSRMLKH